VQPTNKEGYMVKKIAGKTFSTREEAGLQPLTEAELARIKKLMDDFQKKVDAVAPEDRVTDVSPKFWDDTSGTEYESPRHS
jgi:hypothetical protein